MAVLVAGTSLSGREHELRAALESAAGGLAFEPDSRKLRVALEGRAVSCLIAATGGEVRDAAQLLRESDRGAGIPLIALTGPISERVMLGLFAIGADDVVPEDDLVGLSKRLSLVRRLDMRADPVAPQGMCLLAHGDAGRRELLGGVLKRAGFEVQYAATLHEGQSVLKSLRPKVILVSESLPPEGGKVALARFAQVSSASIPSVLIAQSRYSSGHTPDGNAVLPEHAAPSDLLFVIHELLRPRELLDARASPRVLHAGICTFAGEGELFERSIALTYNISREGLYVRTLCAPPTGKRVWLVLRPPGAASAARLGGTVRWTRMRFASGWSAAPPGFAVQLEPAHCPESDLAEYVEYYDRMLRMMELA